MKITLSILLILFTISFCEQSNAQKIPNTAGGHFQKASNFYFGGLAIAGFGGIISYAGANTDSKELVYIGSGLAGVGLLFNMIGWSHIKKGGKMLDDKKLSLNINNGVGIKYTFN